MKRDYLYECYSSLFVYINNRQTPANWWSEISLCIKAGIHREKLKNPPAYRISVSDNV